MEKRKIAKALMITATLAGGLSLGQSLFNEAQSQSYSFYCCEGFGKACRTICYNVPGQTEKWWWS